MPSFPKLKSYHTKEMGVEVSILTDRWLIVSIERSGCKARRTHIWKDDSYLSIIFSHCMSGPISFLVRSASQSLFFCIALHYMRPCNVERRVASGK